MNLSAYVPNASSVPTIGSKVGKNSLLKISAAAVPYRKKSYHSMAVPIRLAVATLTCDGCLVSSAMAMSRSSRCIFVTANLQTAGNGAQGGRVACDIDHRAAALTT